MSYVTMPKSLSAPKHIGDSCVFFDRASTLRTRCTLMRRGDLKNSKRSGVHFIDGVMLMFKF